MIINYLRKGRYVYMIKMIFAHSTTGAFGNGDCLPWDCSEDLAHFKKYTEGCVLVMSEATFRSLPGRLNGRVHVVLSDNPCRAKNNSIPDSILPTYFSLRKACEYAERAFQTDVCIIGGRKLLHEACEFVVEASITELDVECIADIYIDFEDIHEELSERLTPNRRELAGDTTGWIWEYK